VCVVFVWWGVGFWGAGGAALLAAFVIRCYLFFFLYFN